MNLAITITRREDDQAVVLSNGQAEVAMTKELHQRLIPWLKLERPDQAEWPEGIVLADYDHRGFVMEWLAGEAQWNKYGFVQFLQPEDIERLINV